MKAVIKTQQVFKAMYTHEDMTHETVGFVLDLPLDFEPAYEEDLLIYSVLANEWFSVEEILTRHEGSN